MKKICCLFIFLLFANSIFAQTKNKQVKDESQPIVLGITDKIKSTELGETRTINIYLPEGYNKKDTLKYPVIYILDGGLEEDFIHITGIVRFNTQSWIARFPKSIVVGIENTNRRRDFTFSVPNLDFVEKIGFKKESFPKYGGSDKYIAFLEKELQPYIDKKFNTDYHKTVIGESLAGLLATEILLKHRNLFDSYIIIAPSLWWGDQSLLAEAPKLLKAKDNKPVQVYIAACDKDEDKTMYDVAVSLSETLKQNDGNNTKVHYDYIQNEIHSTVIHQAVYNAFKAFYPKTIYQK
ncbi:alpha/beta hydrolase-fold protein [Flavobacterium sp. LS1R49]|uniref:Alpha/beta hydrolase-fold protein n=1 Tax=Flavobacterium shii TaxID=2987687 RepID=A0A9X3C7Q9_9FLAO|nr:alpha/beta hydrolase-fold protein [Flavobacterium shii]MCV9929098.1 alpha/beta hydrolase-fold protein [Flavobacterium shii]